jgi:hypothetical protein
MNFSGYLNLLIPRVRNGPAMPELPAGRRAAMTALGSGVGVDASRHRHAGPLRFGPGGRFELRPAE